MSDILRKSERIKVALELRTLDFGFIDVPTLPGLIYK